MKNVSNNFKEVISKGGPFYAYAKIVLRDGTELELDSTNDFYIDGNSYNESSGDGFPFGVALSKTIDIGIENSNERFSNYDFYYSRITLYTEADLEEGTKERILEGTFTVIDPVSSGDIIEITAADDMYKSDIPYTSKLVYPATTRAILQEACSQSNISLSSAAFENDDFIVMSAPQGLTCRQVIGYIAMIAAGNAVMNEYNQLIIKTYQFPVFDSKKILSGGRFNQELEDMVSGGNFTQIHTNTISGGDLGDGSNYIILSEFSTDPDISTDDVVITGISTTVQGEGQEEDQEYLYGTDDYAIVIENPLIEGKEETAISLIGDLLIGIIARPFSGEFFPDPTVQFMDPVYLVDRKDNIYQSFVTSLTFAYLGNSNISNGLQSPELNKSTYYSTATEVYRKARRDIQKNKTEWEKAVENLGNRLDNASGLYPTEEKQPDGSTIFYLHDKPTLEESQVVIKITAQAIGISTDGGETYPTGITVDGEAIIKILQTVGVNADWINTGAIQVTDDDGSIIFSVDMDTRQVIISGDHVRIGGKTATAAIDDVLQESKDYSDGKLADFADTVTEDLSGLQAQIDGQIETFYEDYEPSLQNYPANEWTSTEERQKHEGDLFYWKSKGYAYRFFQDGATWKWQLVQDTDITQAMAAAEKAQDTADGKRRVFVVTPQPPYDIGDLWTNGEDILTCSTARSAGSAYVSTDWKKLNTYTDDTVANEALEEARKARNLNIILDNEYQGIYADSNGNIGTFPTVQTTVQVLYGHTDVSVDCTYSIAKSSGVTGSWSNAARMYTVTGLSTDSGWVDITASYLNLFTATKRFNVEKIKGGTNGSNGVSVTGTTITYQASSSGTSIPKGNWSPSVPTVSAGRYLWTRTQFNYSDGSHTYSYSVSRMGQNGTDGNDGKGIKSVTNHYLATSSSSGVTTSTSGWTTTVQTITASKKYLWNYETITYTDNSTTNTTPCIIGTYGEKGANGDDGNGISSITEHYAVSSSNTTAPTSWSTTVPTMTKTNKYLWNYETIKYTNGNSVNTTKRVIGVYGDTGPAGTNGTDGKGIKSTAITYQVSSSGTTIPTGTWSSSIPSVSAGQYLWIRTITTYTDNATTTSYSVSRNGTNGAPGRTYMIEPSVNILKRSKDDTISPNFVEFKSYYRDGNSATRTAYNGRWIIEETSDGDTWTTIYTSSANENSVTHYVYSLLADSDGSAIANANGDTIGIPRDVVAIRAKLYAAGGTTNLLDMQSVAVVIDVDNLTHEEIFNLLTNNGAVKGIYQEGDQLYISFTYAKGGELTLGGPSNGNGKLKILTDSGQVVGYIDNTGVHFNQGTFSGSITSSNAIITGGKIQMSASSSETNFIILGFEYSGGSSSLLLSGSSMTLTEGNNVNDVSVRMNRIYNGEESTRISAGNIYVSNDPTGLTPSNYDYCRLHKGGFYVNHSSGRASYLSDGNLQTAGNIYAWGNIGCSGEKSRIADTENYSNRKLYSYELSTPMFGDIGEGMTDQNGECYVFFDDVFLESINPNCEYQVFLQKEGQGDLWIEEKSPQYFIVKGTKNLKFSWEVKVKQKHYEYERLEAYGTEPELEKINYEIEGLKAASLLTQKYLESTTFNVAEYYAGLEEMFV